jgi:hypothetical protein
MNLSNAKELKEKFKQEFVRQHLPSAALARIEGLSGAARFEANAGTLPPDKRLAVGFSKTSASRPHDYRIELRVQRSDSLAQRAAEEFKEQAKGEANIESIPRIEAPSVSLVKEHVKGGSAKNKPSPDALRIGVSVSHPDGPTGTLGAFVASKDGDAILSNAHVLAPGRADQQDHIYHPGGAIVQRLIAGMRIATLREFTIFAKDQSNDIDAAIAVLLSRVTHDGNMIPKDSGHPKRGKRLKNPIDMSDLAAQQRVNKVGYTGYTTGIVSAIALDNVAVDIPGCGVISFSNVMEIRSLAPSKPFTMPGDSGSIVFTENELAPFGLHFAGAYKTHESEALKVSYACDLKTALDALSVSWLK